ncbi:MAG: hypothetical protein Q9216_006337, partial [Gyalolechia sp. 2 TL-2023]
MPCVMQLAQTDMTYFRSSLSINRGSFGATNNAKTKQMWLVWSNRSSLIWLTQTKLHYAACYADIRTLHTLSRVRWITKDIQRLINSMEKDVWTPRRMIEARRSNNMASQNGNTHSSIETDHEETYKAFMVLVQKMMDDYYHAGDDPSGRLYGPLRQRLVPVPLMGTWQWGMCEQDSASEQSRYESEHLDAHVPGGDIATATAVPKPSAELNLADTEEACILHDPPAEYTSSTAEMLLSEVQRDEFKW